MPFHFGRISAKSRDVRDKIVEDAEYILTKAQAVHYSQARPVDLDFRKLNKGQDWTADCSGSTIAIYHDAGAMDPSGNRFDGAGNTDSILRTLTPIPRGKARRGDLVLFHNGSDGKHVAILLQSPRWHGDPLLESHGSEYGPLRLPLSSEQRYHSSETMTFLKGVPDWLPS